MTGQNDEAQVAVCRILLIEDDAPVRLRLAGIIGDWSGARLVGACGTLADALQVIDNIPIDLLVTDLKLPDGHGVQAILRLRERQPAAEAMVISVLADDRTVIEAIEAGATGYILKDSDPIGIVEAISELLAGRSPISSAIARTIVRRLGGRSAALGGVALGGAAVDGAAASTVPAGKPAAAALTPREMDILWGVAKGLTYGELADSLKISRQTVPVHIRNIYRKLEASNRSEAVYEASRRGLIRL